MKLLAGICLIAPLLSIALYAAYKLTLYTDIFIFCMLCFIWSVRLILEYLIDRG